MRIEGAKNEILNFLNESRDKSMPVMVNGTLRMTLTMRQLESFLGTLDGNPEVKLSFPGIENNKYKNLRIFPVPVLQEKRFITVRIVFTKPAPADKGESACLQFKECGIGFKNLVRDTENSFKVECLEDEFMEKQLMLMPLLYAIGVESVF